MHAVNVLQPVNHITKQKTQSYGQYSTVSNGKRVVDTTVHSHFPNVFHSLKQFRLSARLQELHRELPGVHGRLQESLDALGSSCWQPGVQPTQHAETLLRFWRWSNWHPGSKHASSSTLLYSPHRCGAILVRMPTASLREVEMWQTTFSEKKLHLDLEICQIDLLVHR